MAKNILENLHEDINITDFILKKDIKGGAMSRLIITIKDGEVKMKIEKTPGKDCLAETKDIEQNLGEIKSRQLTSEFYSQNENIIVKRKVKTS
jgi:hypothetical protein